MKLLNSDSSRDHSVISVFEPSSSPTTERETKKNDARSRTEALEKRVNAQTAELTALNTELDSFVYSVSHDLRTPLRHIEAFATLLRESSVEDLDEESAHYLDTIEKAAKRVSSQVDDLVEFHSISRKEFTRRRVDMNEVVESVIAQLGAEAVGRQIEWEVGRLPSIKTDQLLISIAWTNLIRNAIKFTGTRELAVIQIGLNSETADSLTYFIRDNGVGFDPRYMSNLFGVFQRLHRRDEFEGAGMGLAIVRRIVHRCGGLAWAEATLGSGATFFVTLPKE